MEDDGMCDEGMEDDGIQVEGILELGTELDGIEDGEGVRRTDTDTEGDTASEDTFTAENTVGESAFSRATNAPLETAAVKV